MISSAVSQSAVARSVGILTKFKNLGNGVTLLPQRIVVIGQGSTSSVYSTTKEQVFTAKEAGEKWGYGSPLHLAISQLLPVYGDGVGTIPVTGYPLDDAVSSVASTGDVTPSGSQTSASAYTVRISGIESEQFVINAGDSVAVIVDKMVEAVNAVLEMPVIASDGSTKMNLTSKWKGTSANDIVVEVLGDTTLGTTFAITQPNGGLINPDVDDALAQVGDVWETLIVNCFEVTDSGTLDKLQTWGEGRWGADTKKPLAVSLCGSFEKTVSTLAAIGNGRKTDRVNGVITAPGCVNLPCVIAARAMARIAKIADNNPPVGYAGQRLTDLIPGADGDQWNNSERDTAVKAGISTTEIKDGLITMSDTVTFYHPDGEVVPAHRYVVANQKLMTIIFNLDLTFNSDTWNDKPLVPDHQLIANPEAKKPLMAKAAISMIIDELALEAILSEPETAKKSIIADINTTNPNRLDISVTVQLSGNVGIISIDLNFGFLFGTRTAIA